MMDLKRLRTFVAVAEERGFARAAARLNLAQPAVSKQVRDLEEDLGGPLFLRQSDGIRLTHAGDLLLEGARRLLGAAAELRERARRAAQGESGLLRIGYNETVSWGGVIPRTIHAFRRTFPEVILKMLPMTSVEQLAALREKRLDAGFLFNRRPDDPEFAGHRVLVDRVMLAAQAGSRWARQPPACLAELSGEPFIWMPRHVTPLYSDAVRAHCAAAGLVMNVVQEAMNESAALSLVAVGMGMTFVPASARRRCPEDVAILPVPDMTLETALEIVWRRDVPLEPATRRFIDTALRIAQDLDESADGSRAANG